MPRRRSGLRTTSPSKADHAARRLVEPAGHAHQGGLAAAGGAEKDDELVARNRQAERLGDHLDGAEALVTRSKAR